MNKKQLSKKYLDYKNKRAGYQHTQDTYVQSIVDPLRDNKDTICDEHNTSLKRGVIKSITKPVETPLSALDSLINYFSNIGTVSCKHFEEDVLYKLLVDYTYNLDEIIIISTERRLITPTIGCINLWIVGKRNPIVIYTKGYPFKDIKVILPKS